MTERADKVWIPDAENVWQVAEVIDMSADEKTLTVEVEDKVIGAYMNREVKKGAILSHNEDHEKDFDNAFDMGDLNEAAILALLKRRSLEDKIYTFTGNILLSVNPYKSIPNLYEPMPAPGSLNSEDKNAKPHLYVLADRVARDLFENGIRGTSQSVLINGESGAGKTVAAKQIMAFLADLSQHKRKEAEKKGNKRGGYGGRPGYGGAARGRPVRGGGKTRPSRFGGGRKEKKKSKLGASLGGRKGTKAGEAATRTVSQVEDTILRTNPLLEAFGNARTIRNDNSSRFGKFTQLNYSQQHVIIGAKTRHFLLEKSRIVSHGSGERNYHIFYMFCAAYEQDPSNKVFSELKSVLPATDYNYLQPSASAPVELEEDPRRRRKKKDVREGVSAMAKRAAEFLSTNADKIRAQDLEEFEAVTKAFNDIDVNTQDQANVYRVIAAVLYLGNLKFVDAKDDDGFPYCDVVDEDDIIQTTAGLLGVEKHLLLNALCKRTVKAGNRKSMTELALTADEAAQSRDGLSKAMYEALFEWLVQKINIATGAAVNNSMETNKRGKKERKQELFIGILDIFGFEILQDNSFEQLCINYANEALQGMFDEHVLKLEMESYEAESINIQLDFRDNKELLNLLNLKGNGIFQLMDQQGAFGKNGSDEGLLKSINAIHGQRKNQRLGQVDFDAAIFEVKHFAGIVEYNVTGMVEKNADHLQPDLADLIAIGGMPEEPKEMTEEEQKQAQIDDRQRKKATKKRPSVLGARQSSKPVVDDDDGPPPEDIKETFPFLQAILKLREAGAKAVSESASKANDNKKGGKKKKQRKMARLVSVSSRFRTQMSDLQALLESSDQHFVRCIKPNDKKVPPQEAGGWNAPMVSQQLKMLGALEMVRVRREGYPVRSEYADVLARYPELLKEKKIELSDEMDERKACAALMNAFYEGGKGKLWAMGDFKCFMREQVSRELDEKERKIYTDRLDKEERAERRRRDRELLEKNTKAVTVLQRWGRGVIARRQVKGYLKAVVTLQAIHRKVAVKEKLRKQADLVIKIQAMVRGYLQRTKYGTMSQLVKTRIQAIVRGVLVRKKFKRVMRGRSKYKSLLRPGESIVLLSRLTFDSKAKRTTAGQPHVLILTTGPLPRILYVNDKNSKLKAELVWNFFTISALLLNERSIVLMTDPSGPNRRKNWRFQFMLPEAAKWQLALHEPRSIYDLMGLAAPDERDDEATVRGNISPLDVTSGFYFGGPTCIGGSGESAAVYAQETMDMTQKAKWRKRYFLLKGTSLYWFESEQGPYPLGAVTINGHCIVSPGKKNNSKYVEPYSSKLSLEIQSPLLSTPLLLHCTSQNARVNWSRALTRCIKRRREKAAVHKKSITQLGIINNKAFSYDAQETENFDDKAFDVLEDQEEDIELVDINAI